MSTPDGPPTVPTGNDAGKDDSGKDGSGKHGSGKDAGVLVLCGTPLGNLGDAPPRLVDALGTADVIAAEDTRRFRRLAAGLGVTVTARVVSYYDAVEVARTPDLVADLTAGATVVLVTDAGMPAVSDPGYRLVAAAAAAGVRVTAVPGPSAVTTALALSGLPCDRWTFEGFLPRKSAARHTRLAELATEPRTLVLLEAPHRLAAMLTDLRDVFGVDRPAVVCRELTKTYEQVIRGSLDEIVAWTQHGELRGEITVVVGGAPPPVVGPADPQDLVAAVAAREAAGTSRKEAIIEVARATGLQRRVVYDAVVAGRHAAAAAGT